MAKGRFGIHGGQYIPETLMNAVIELEEAYEHYKKDPEFIKELDTLLHEYVGRPSGLYYAAHMTEDLGGAKIYLKREDLNHTGSHKLNNALGQALLAKKMGKTRLIAETGAGQHGVATATVRRHPHPEHGTGSAEGDGSDNADKVSHTNAGRSGDDQCLKRGEIVWMFFFLTQRADHVRKQTNREKTGANRKIDACRNQEQKHQRDAD